MMSTAATWAPRWPPPRSSAASAARSGRAALDAVFAARSVGTPEGGDTGLLLTALGMAGHRTGQLPPPLASAALASAVPNLLAPIYLVMADVGVADPRRALPLA